MAPIRFAWVTLLLVGWSSVAWSQPLVRVEGGLSAVHSEVRPAAGLHLLLPLDARQAVRLDVGGFLAPHALSADAGLSVRAPTNAPLALILRGGGGMLAEPEWSGPYVRVGTGLEWRQSPLLALTAAFETGVHDGLPGPHRVMIGVVRQLGAGGDAR